MLNYIQTWLSSYLLSIKINELPYLSNVLIHILPCVMHMLVITSGVATFIGVSNSPKVVTQLA